MGNSGVASLLHRLAQPSQDGLLVPSQNRSSLDSQVTQCSFTESVPHRQVCFLHGIQPGPVSQHAGPLGASQQTMYHSPGCPMVFFWTESFLPL